MTDRDKVVEAIVVLFVERSVTAAPDGAWVSLAQVADRVGMAEEAVRDAIIIERAQQMPRLAVSHDYGMTLFAPERRYLARLYAKALQERERQ